MSLRSIRRHGQARTPRWRWVAALLVVVAAVVGLAPQRAEAQASPRCSWPVETGPDSLANVAYPDTNAIYWTMPIDTARWSSVIITGAFPAVRFMSLTTYDSQGAAVEGLLDLDIRPDQGSRNPFDPGKAAQVAGRGGNYSVLVDQGNKAPKGGNHLRLASDTIGFIIYRIYVPNKGQNLQGGVDLPAEVAGDAAAFVRVG